MERIEAIVSGKVQGVAYRDFVKRKAAGLALVGEVENLEDKTVRVIAEGSRSALETLLTHLNKGPLFAHVDHIAVLWTPVTETFTEFSIR